MGQPGVYILYLWMSDILICIEILHTHNDDHSPSHPLGTRYGCSLNCVFRREALVCDALTPPPYVIESPNPHGDPSPRGV